MLGSDLNIVQFGRVWCKLCTVLPGGPDSPGGPDPPGWPADSCMERHGKKIRFNVVNL